MNIYNLEEMKGKEYIYNHKAEELIRKYKNSMTNYKIIYVLLIIILAVLCISTNDFLGFLIMSIVIFICILFKMMSISIKYLIKAKEDSVHVTHDCYYYLYKTLKLRKNKNRYLIQLCKINIIMHEYESGYLCLTCIDFDKLSNKDKCNYYLLKLVINKLRGENAEFIRDLESYIENERLYGDMDAAHKEINILKNGSDEEINNLVNMTKLQNEYLKIFNYIFSFTVFSILVFLFLKIPELLPNQIEYRSWVDILGQIAIFIGIIVFPAIIINSIIKMKCKYKGWDKFIAYIVFFMMLLFYITSLAFIRIFYITDISSDKRIDDEIIEVRQHSFLSEDRIYYCRPYTIFFRKVISYDENYLEDKNDSSYEQHNDNNSDNTKVEEKNKTSSNRNSNTDISNNNNNVSNTKDEEPFGEDTSVIMGYHKIYLNEFQTSGDSIEFRTSAKGRTYVIIGPEQEKDVQGEKVKTTRRLVYDRESKNGKCNLYVYYEDHHTQDGNIQDNTSILNFYAVNKSTGEVIKADKTSWQESGSDAYIKATGEY